MDLPYRMGNLARLTGKVAGKLPLKTIAQVTGRQADSIGFLVLSTSSGIRFYPFPFAPSATGGALFELKLAQFDGMRMDGLSVDVDDGVFHRRVVSLEVEVDSSEGLLFVVSE